MKLSINSKHYYRFTYLKSEHWSNLRINKLASVKGKCKICGVKKYNNDVHHLNYRNLFDVKKTDLVVVCRDCHIKIHSVLDQCTSYNDIESSKKKWHYTIKNIRKEERKKIISEKINTYYEAKPFFVKFRKFYNFSIPNLKLNSIVKFFTKNKKASNKEWLEYCLKLRSKNFIIPNLKNIKERNRFDRFMPEFKTKILQKTKFKQL